MSNNPIVIPEKIHLQNIRVINGSIDTDPEFNVKEIDGFETYFEVTTGINEEKNAVRLVVTAKFIGMDKSDTALKANAEYKVDFHFMVENLLDFLVKDGEPPATKLHSILGATLAAISYSTLRGIVLTRTQGTILDGIILPVINPSHLLTNKFSEPAKP
jgi:hypothetical protein